MCRINAWMLFCVVHLQNRPVTSGVVGGGKGLQKTNFTLLPCWKAQPTVRRSDGLDPMLKNRQAVMGTIDASQDHVNNEVHDKKVVTAGRLLAEALDVPPIGPITAPPAPPHRASAGPKFTGD